MKYKILDILRENDSYISGEQLASLLGITRAAVWKHILRLKEEGYTIVSGNNRGYLLIDKNDVVNIKELKYKNICYKKEVDSTNDEAKRLALNGANEGLVVVANNQTKGKGRLGKSWISIADKNIYMSIILRPNITPIEAPCLTLVVGLAVLNVINNMTELSASIKWPNDIIINNKKVCGILTEISAEIYNIKFAVVGIGVNVNSAEFDAEIKHKSTSLLLETGKSVSRANMIDNIISEVTKYYNSFVEKGFINFIDEYNNNCINIGRYVRTVGRVDIEGKAVGVNDRGELLIETDNEVVPVFSGEVSLRMSNGEYI